MGNGVVRKRKYHKQKKLKSEVAKAATYIKNLSKHKLADHETLVLGKGLKFVPTPQKPKIEQTLKDWRDLSKRMRYRYIYANKPKTQGVPFFEKSSTYPGPTECMGLENFLCHTRLDIERIFQKGELRRPKNNVTINERKAILALRNNKEIVIRKADKSNTTVILDKDDYVTEGHRQLTSARHYRPLDKDITLETQLMVNNVVKRMYNAREINKQTLDFLVANNKTVRTPQMYLLPKIHKPVLTGRPIISGINGPLERVSKFVDYFLKPIVTKQTTYIRDTSDFINRIEKTVIPDNAILVVADIESMYTNIEHKSALASVKKALCDNNDIQYKICRPSIQSLTELLALLLTRNTFQFDSQNYIQTCGCPMGQPASPEICDITIYEMELELIKKAGDKMGSYMRFRDDLFWYWLGTIPELEKFMLMANNFHSTLKFTYEFSLQSVTFLDTQLYKGPRFNNENILDIKTHTKSTNTFQYLHRTSCHPNSVFKGFIKGELLRYIRNSSNVSDFEKIKNSFKTHLINRGYAQSEIDTACCQVHHNERNIALQTGGKTKDCNSIPLVFTTTHNPCMPNIKNILLKHWHYINKVPKLSTIFPQVPTMAYRKNKSVYNFVVRAKLPLEEDESDTDENPGLTQLLSILETDPDAK
jgi:hypothetical protein